jgi:transcriptional regulator with XRE-family HTH domain
LKVETSLEKQISQAIHASGRSLRDLSRASGLDPGQLSRFVRGQRSLHLPQAAKLCEVLGLELVPKKPKKALTKSLARA